jgi:hypothetical protein
LLFVVIYKAAPHYKYADFYEEPKHVVKKPSVLLFVILYKAVPHYKYADFYEELKHVV